MTGDTTRRGYGNLHQQIRKRWARLVAVGGVVCAECGGPIQPGEPWDLGHQEDRGSGYIGPEHRWCNRSKAARKRNALARLRTEAQQRLWSRW